MPQTIDETTFRERATFDVSAAPNSPTGIPMKQIPILEYPRVVYKHPREPFKTILHRNTKQEIVREEMVQSEHLTKVVEDEKQLKAALKEGWVKEAYVPQELPDPDAHLYETAEATAK